MTISSLFGNAVPANPDSPDAGAPVELGVRFYSTVAGWITHIRFYKSAANTGPHTVSLWTAGSASPVAMASTSGNEPTGWVNVPLTTPVATLANVAHIASYNSTVGHYAADAHVFTSGPVTSGQLVGPQSANSNGVFAYGPPGTEPTLCFNDASYGVDLYFTDTDPSGSVGAVAATQAPNTMAAAGAVLVSGAVAATQQLNTMAAAGQVTTPSRVGTVAATQAPNVAAIAGSSTISGTVAATQKPNTAHAVGRVGSALERSNGYTAQLQRRHWIVSLGLPS